MYFEIQFSVLRGLLYGVLCIKCTFFKRLSCSFKTEKSFSPPGIETIFFVQCMYYITLWGSRNLTLPNLELCVQKCFRNLWKFVSIESLFSSKMSNLDEAQKKLENNNFPEKVRVSWRTIDGKQFLSDNL